MTNRTLSSLAWTTLDFSTINDALATLAHVLTNASREVPACRKAAKRLATLRRNLEAVQTTVDDAVYDASQSWEDGEDDLADEIIRVVPEYATDWDALPF